MLVDANLYTYLSYKMATQLPIQNLMKKYTMIENRRRLKKLLFSNIGWELTIAVCISSTCANSNNAVNTFYIIHFWVENDKVLISADRQET